MNMRAMVLLAPMLGLVLSATALAAETIRSPRFVGGLMPYQRPAGAPVMREFAPDAKWLERALTGIPAPKPDSLQFLYRQGAWYSPFVHPGMPGYYDLRNWHRSAGASDGR